MACYHPLIGIRSGERTINGKRKVEIIGRLDDNGVEDLKLNPDAVLIPCGNCIGCRLDYSRKWADRMILELETAKKGIFVTLTYDNDHIPWCYFNENGFPLYGTVCKSDCQLFMKRLRDHFNDLCIRFYLAAEYGESETRRPHYHAILFGIGLDDLDNISVFGRNELGQPYYISPELTKIWKQGHVLVCNVSWQTCAYVSRYVTKKMKGLDKDINYLKYGQLPEFALMSRKPGIGSKYLELHPDILDLSYINISTDEKGLKIAIPEYYLQKLKLTDEKKYDKIKEDRKRFANDKMLIELFKTDLGMESYLESKELNKVDKISNLKRNKVR